MTFQFDVLRYQGFQPSFEVEALIKGDSKSFLIAAASIVAKVVRDRICDDMAKKWPEYW
jgi:ribonuclease HII